MHLENRRTHYHAVGGHTVITALCEDGEYIAYFMDYYKGENTRQHMRSRGYTRFAALTNLHAYYTLKGENA